jgi:hypothetical protein
MYYTMEQFDLLHISPKFWQVVKFFGMTIYCGVMGEIGLP